MAPHPGLPARTVLPIPEQRPSGATAVDAKDPGAVFPPIQPLRPPGEAPNVLIILLDDVGFGASSTFGGPCRTPTADRLAGRGLRYTRFHTTALCAPTRQALLTGRNHHAVVMGALPELATGNGTFNELLVVNGAAALETPEFLAERIGCDSGSPVSDDYTPEQSRFTGTISWVRLDAGDDTHDQLITPEDRYRLALARQ
jgi:hypothetical protein